ncbi:hypothetical protein D770_14570 [Flammeovirgaceae bacterium 311]|nr:hypothetical protein D770_14570 [Flammeovirgaceae bacterium 311]
MKFQSPSDLYRNKKIYAAIMLMAVLMAGCIADKQNVASPEIKTETTLVYRTRNKTIPSMATWGMSRYHIDKAVEHSSFTHLVTLRNLGSQHDVTADSTVEKTRKLAEYAASKGLYLIGDLDVRLAPETYLKKYPNDQQGRLMFQDIKIAGQKSAEVNFNRPVFSDHYQRPYLGVSGKFVEAYAYNLGPNGLIDPASLIKITEFCKVEKEDRDELKLSISKLPANRSYATVISQFTYRYHDVFAPGLEEFQVELINKYRGVPLGGAHNDEFGFPQMFNESNIKNEFWYTHNRAQAYATETGGRNLVDDLLLMRNGIEGKEAERLKAINVFMEMALLRMGKLETLFYNTVKDVFGSEAVVGVHSTWFPYPDRREYMKNGLDWWLAKRDFAQTDEVVPFGIRTALSKKWNSPVWYNMYYRYFQPEGFSEAKDYEWELYRSALGGGRVNNLPVIIEANGILASEYVQGENKVQLLDYIKPSPLNSPVAVIFGYHSAVNWASENYEDVGMALVDSLWSKGVATDLIPSYEIDLGNVVVDEEGYIRYGSQQYRAVVLHKPDMEKSTTSAFFKNAQLKKTKVYRLGEWKRDYDGHLLQGRQHIPAAMVHYENAELLTRDLISLLKKEGVNFNTPTVQIMEGFGHSSIVPAAAGHAWLLDGTLVQAAGEHSGAGDPIQSKMKIGEQEVVFDAVGIAAIRLDKKGEVEAIAAGDLKHVKCGSFELNLPHRLNVALWKNERGQWEGVVQGGNSSVPASLLKLTSNWTILKTPAPFSGGDFKKPVVIDLKKGANAAGNYAQNISTVKDIDNNEYKVADFGGKLWFVDNLRVSRYTDGTPIMELGTEKEQSVIHREAGMSWYKNDSAAYSQYGRLYNWKTATLDNICPEGWRVPNNKDWTELMNILSKSDQYSSATFFSEPAGYRHPYGSFFFNGDFGVWWSASGANSRLVYKKKPDELWFYANERNDQHPFFYSIRCVKCEQDTNSTTSPVENEQSSPGR